MFDAALSELNQALEGLRLRRVRAEELLGKLPEGEKKRQIDLKYQEVCHAIERVALCISILEYQVSVEIDEDFDKAATVRDTAVESVIRFPGIKEAASQGSLV